MGASEGVVGFPRCTPSACERMARIRHHEISGSEAILMLVGDEQKS
jgi:hypothetical protein